jgi:hypothetical protein
MRARRRGYWAIGVTCPRCWRATQPRERKFAAFCQCDDGAIDELEETLAIHGLTGVRVQWASAEDVRCG